MRPENPIYLDHQSTTPVDPRVRAAMLPFLGECFGNPASSQHQYGWTAEAAVTVAREQVAALIDASPAEIVFTGSATEANNLAVKGVMEARASEGAHCIVSAIEHASVLESARHLERGGARVTILGVDSNGRVDPAQVADAMTNRTVLVSIIHASNEIGTIQDLAAIGAICRARKVTFHSDAAQSVSKIPVPVAALNADLLTLSAHKMYGPKGVGALYVRAATPRLRLAPQLDGGGQEGGLRSGTLNVACIAGFGAAAELAREELESANTRIAALRDRLQDRLLRIGGAAVHGDQSRRLPDNLSIRFDGLPAAVLLRELRGLALSTGSACSSGSGAPSHVLAAIGLEKAAAASTLRISLGRGTTESDIDAAARAMETAVPVCRARFGEGL